MAMHLLYIHILRLLSSSTDVNSNGNESPFVTYLWDGSNFPATNELAKCHMDGITGIDVNSNTICNPNDVINKTSGESKLLKKSLMEPYFPELSLAGCCHALSSVYVIQTLENCGNKFVTDKSDTHFISNS